MKKITIIFSFILISVFSTGSYFLHKLYLKNYKKEFKAHIKQFSQSVSFSTVYINLSELYTNSTNIIWQDENKEVVYNGILYDVVSVNGKGLSVELTLVSDREEMALKADFAKMYDVSSHQTTKGPFELLKTFLTLKYIVHTFDLELNNFTMDRSVSFVSYVFLITTRFIAQDVPPPDFSA